MPLTTWRRLAALALLLAAAALAVAGCDRRPSDPARPSIGSTTPGVPQGSTPGSIPGSTPGSTSGTTSGIAAGIAPDITPSTPPSTTTGSGIRVLDGLTPALPTALAAPLTRPPP